MSKKILAAQTAHITTDGFSIALDQAAPQITEAAVGMLSVRIRRVPSPADVIRATSVTGTLALPIPAITATAAALHMPHAGIITAWRHVPAMPLISVTAKHAGFGIRARSTAVDALPKQPAQTLRRELRPAVVKPVGLGPAKHAVGATHARKITVDARDLPPAPTLDPARGPAHAGARKVT